MNSTVGICRKSTFFIPDSCEPLMSFFHAQNEGHHSAYFSDNSFLFLFFFYIKKKNKNWSEDDITYDLGLPCLSAESKH